MNARIRGLSFAFAFCLTGVGTALLGATLPATLHDWQLSDSRGGLILFAAWAGSTLGALFARGTSGRSAVFGLALSAFELVWLSFGRTRVPTLSFFLYGLGLGMAMTAISLWRAHEVSAADADVELNRLNLLWALGACFAPVIALHSLRLLTTGELFRMLSILFTLTALVLAISLAFAAPATRANFPSSAGASLPWVPLGMCLFAAAAVGLESAVGSWLTTYARRSHIGIPLAVSANSFFWAGLLLSRGLHSIPRARALHTPTARAIHVALAGVSLVLLTMFPTRWLLPAGGLLCGLGLGPLYPFVLSVALPRFRSLPVFVSAGVGAALVPWLTGAVSSAYGSLRIGLLASCAAFLLLAATTARVHAKPTSPVPGSNTGTVPDPAPSS